MQTISCTRRALPAKWRPCGKIYPWLCSAAGYDSFRAIVSGEAIGNTNVGSTDSSGPKKSRVKPTWNALLRTPLGWLGQPSSDNWATATAPGRKTTTCSYACWQQAIVWQRYPNGCTSGGCTRARLAYGLWGYGATGRALRRALVAEGKHAAAIVEVHPRRLAAHHHRPPFLAPPALKQWAHLPLLISVSGAEAREEIRTFLADFPYREGENCLFTA